MNRLAWLVLLVLASAPARAALPGVIHWSTATDLETSYDNIYKSLEKNRFYVVFEPDIGRNLAGFSEHWGADYNRNGLGGIRALVFCSAWYANQVSNLDPRLLALCPLHITLYRQGGMTHVVFLRPTRIGSDTAAATLLQDLEADVVAAVEHGLAAEKDPAPAD